MPKKDLNKVHKQISRKRGKISALHENSRDAKRLRRATARDDKLARSATVAIKGRQAYVDRVAYFQEAVNNRTDPLSNEETVQLIEKFVTRHNDELNQLRTERRKGRPPSKREETLTQREEGETKEFAAGFWVPDPSDGDNLVRLKMWNGEWSAMSSIAFVRVSKDGGKKESTFPPRGLS